jgi:hypothetical protein
MSVTVRRYKQQDAEAWDRLVAKSWNGTFVHERRFLSHHGERFQDLSLLIEDHRGRIAGVFPAALDATRKDLVTSHPGLTYGGVVHDGSLQGTTMLETLGAIAQVYRAGGLRLLRYRVVPYIYHRVPSADDLYALFRLDAVRYRCDLSAAIDLAFPQRLSKLRRRNLNKARRSGVQVVHGAHYFEPFWAVLEENLASKYGAQPVHTLDEIARLQSMLPEHIECIVSVVEGEIVAGVVLFCTPHVVRIQYAASTTVGNSIGALTAVVNYAIEKSRDWKARYFDFGTSNACGGRVLNQGLYQFKTSYGAGGVVHEFYELKLRS